jgi:hypothetical protein
MHVQHVGQAHPAVDVIVDKVTPGGAAIVGVQPFGYLVLETKDVGHPISLLMVDLGDYALSGRQGHGCRSSKPPAGWLGYKCDMECQFLPEIGILES